MADPVQLTIDGREAPVLASQASRQQYEQPRMFDHAPSMRGQLAMPTDGKGSEMQATPATTARPLTCEICGQQVVEGERYTMVCEEFGEVEHVACTDGWFRRNFGRESLR